MDKKHEKFLIYAGLGLVSLSSFLIFFSTNFYTLLFFASLNGIALGFAHAIIYPAGAKLFSLDRDKKMAKQGSAGDAGKLCALITSAIVLGINNNDWQLPFLIWGGFAFIALIIVGIQLRSFNFAELNQMAETRESQNIHEQEPLHKVTISRKVIALLFIITAIYYGSSDIVTKMYTLYLQNARTGLSQEFATTLFTFMVAGGTLGSYTSGYFKTKLGIRKFLTFVYIILLILEILYIRINLDNFLFDAVFATLIGYLLFAVYITIQSEPSYYMNPKKLGVGYGLLLGFSWTGSTLSVFIFGPMAAIYGPAFYFLVSIILGVGVFILVQFLPIRSTLKTTPPKIIENKK